MNSYDYDTKPATLLALGTIIATGVSPFCAELHKTEEQQQYKILLKFGRLIAKFSSRVDIG